MRPANGEAIGVGLIDFALDPWNHMGGWSWVGMTLMMVAFLALIVLVTSSLVGRGGVGPSAIEILDERYARGEIDDEELHRRRQTLEGGRGR